MVGLTTSCLFARCDRLQGSEGKLNLRGEKSRVRAEPFPHSRRFWSRHLRHCVHPLHIHHVQKTGFDDGDDGEGGEEEEEEEDNDADDDDDEDDTAPLCPSLMMVIMLTVFFYTSNVYHLPLSIPAWLLFPFKSSVDREAPSVLSQTSSCTK